MKKIRYVELVELLAKKTNLKKEDVRNVMDNFINEVHQLKDEGDKLYLRKLGKFEVVTMKAKEIELNNKMQHIPERKMIRFRNS